MKIFRRRRTLQMAAVSCATLASLAVALPASAAQPATHPAAFNETTMQLTTTPVSSDPRACVSRSIILAAGSYTFENIGDFENLGITIPAGTYAWQDCLQASVTNPGFYDQTTELIAPNGEEAASLDSVRGFVGLPPNTLVTTTWGSELIPGF
ncbi:hypothetical protein ABH935_009857 [Catenulispora sp. GAS73]|uniref:hypothetical protein n=1 Tax=Catenulispora sp. GAS73 TaxID=3156269 RepID=UPI003518464D